MLQHANTPPVDMAERRIEDFRLASPGWGMDGDNDEDLDFPLREELPSELSWIGILSNQVTSQIVVHTWTVVK